MDYYDGNTVTGLWNYAQQLRDERQLLRHRVRAVHAGSAQPDLRPDLSALTGLNSAGQAASDPSVIGSPDAHGIGTVVRRRGPVSTTDAPTTRPDRVQMSGPNIGDLLNAEGRHLGLVRGRLRADQHRRPSGTAGLRRQRTPTSAAQTVTDYIPHHEPFQYYASTANPAPQAPGQPGRGRPHRPGQPPVRPELVLQGPERREPARGELPQGRRVPGRPRRATPTRSTSRTSW